MDQKVRYAKNGYHPVSAGKGVGTESAIRLYKMNV